MSGGSGDTRPVCVLGGGSWGTALGRHLALKGVEVTLWVHDADLASSMARSRANQTYLPGFPLPEGLEITSSLPRALRGAGSVILAVPSRYCRAVLEEAAGELERRAPLIVASKGIERESLLTVCGMASQVLGRSAGAALAVLSGPSFAREVADHRPTAVVAASGDEELAKAVQSLLRAPGFRVYTSSDAVGVELGGALKNVVAIAAGVIEGVGLGSNSLAALITRGLAEISRLAVALGGRRQTLAGLAGLGDLVLTCTGALSRNRQVGLSLGKGRSLQETLAGMKMVAEGVDTARSALELGRREGISMPITEKVNQVLFEGKPPEEGVRELMTRPPRPEID